MKKSLSAFLVHDLSLIGATSLASHFDFNLKSNIHETADKKGSQNGNNGDNGTRSMVSKDK